MKHIEVELRGPLTDADHTTLKKYLKKNGKIIGSQKRLFFDLSQIIGINNRSLDVRAKVTNGQVHIVIKKSSPGNAAREEIDLPVAEGSLKQVLHALALLGYKKGIYGDRRITKYKVKDIEFAIQDVVCVTDGKFHSRFYEAEILTYPAEQKKAEKRLRKILAELRLPVFDTKGWNKYEKSMNSEANGWYDFSTTETSNLASRHK